MARFAFVIGIVLGIAAPAVPQQPAKDPGLAAVPRDAFAFVSVKVSKLWDNPAAKPFRDWVAKQEKDGILESLVGVPFGEIDRVTVFVPRSAKRRDEGEPITIVTTRKKYAEAQVLKALAGGLGDGKQLVLSGRVAQLPKSHEWFRSVILVNERTLLFTGTVLEKNKAHALLKLFDAGNVKGIFSEVLVQAERHDIVACIDVGALAGKLLPKASAKGPELDSMRLLLKAKTAILTVDFGETARARFVISFPDAQSAKLAFPGLEKGIKIVESELSNELKRTWIHPTNRLGLEWALKIWKRVHQRLDGPNLIAEIEAALDDEFRKLTTVVPQLKKDNMVTMAAMQNLKRLTLGMLDYADSTEGQMPGDVESGKNAPAMSWRVQILPYIGAEEVYKQLDHTKPWDDPKNLRVLQTIPMPRVFEHPGRPAPKRQTYFRVFTMPKQAKGTARPLFKEGQRGPQYPRDIVDGTSNTFMIVEARESVPWYQPDVLPYDGKLPLPPLGGENADHLIVSFCDGGLWLFRPGELQEKSIRAFITIGGGEEVERDPK